jgi:hypothetical protein
MKRTHRRKTHHRRSTHRRRGGAALSGAPINYHLSGSWPSRMSLGQGEDYFKYHQGQHGGAAPLTAIGQTLPVALRGPAHIGGIDKALMDVRGLRDPPYDGSGGKRRKGRKGSKSSKRHHSRKHRMTRRRRRGGSLGYAPFPSKGMLLSGNEYAQAGLNPGWKTDVAFKAAEVRQGQ